MIEANDRPMLRALPGGQVREPLANGRAATASDALGAALDECAISRAAVRAGDRHEPWTLPVGSSLAAVAGAAAEAGVEFELAVRLCVEAALVRDDLRPLGVDPTRLDALAGAAVVERRVEAADCAYLRRLTRRSPASQRRALGDAVIVGLPARLSARLLTAAPALAGVDGASGGAAEALDALLANADVGSALAWETAAVLDGRTISEWAPLAALRALASGIPAAT